MEKKTRRAFLRWMAMQMSAVLGGSLLASCGRQESHSLQTTALPIAKPIQPTDVDPTARTVSFAFTAGDNSGAGTFVVSFYQHRIPGSGTTARLFERPGGVMVAANDADGECIAGMRRRDRFQGHFHEVYGMSDAGSASDTLRANTGGGSFTRAAKRAATDEVNGEPRTGKTNDPRALVGHMYLWGKKFVA